MQPHGGEIQPPISKAGVIFEDNETSRAVERPQTPSALHPIHTSSGDRFRGMTLFRRIGMVFNMAVVMSNTAMHPMPEGIGFNDAEGIAASIATLPWMASVLIPVADAGQAFFGALISATITPIASMAVAMIVGVLSMLAGIANLLSMPLPAWR